MSFHVSCQHELSKDEVFLGNTNDGIGNYLAGLKTIRLGTQAYSIHGDALGDEYRPLIINRSEIPAYDKIMEARLSRVRAGEYKCERPSPSPSLSPIQQLKQEDLFEVES